MNGGEPAMGGYFMPVDRRDIARGIRQELEGLWSWSPEMEGVAEELRRVEHFGAPGSRLYASGPSYFLTVVTGPYGREMPMDEWMVRRELSGWIGPGPEVLVRHMAPFPFSETTARPRR